MSENLIGATTAIFPIRLSVAVTSPVDVEWATRDGSAIAGSDYKAASGTVTFLPGETEKQIEVQVYGQAITPEDDKVFFIRLNPPSNAVLVDAILTCTINIIDDQGIPSVAVVVAEGRRGPKGDPGLSAYEQAVFMGYTGTLAEWMDQIADASKAADRAEDYAISASEDALKAQNAAKNAVFAGVIFPTVAEGVDPVLGVQNGAYFNVRSPMSEHYIDEYQNVNGVAVATGKSYPTSDYLQNISDHTALPFETGESYALNRRVILTNGDIVKSNIDGNANDPNVDMTGWLNIGNTGEVESIAELIAITSPKNGGRVFVKSYHSGIGKGGGDFIYDSSRALENDGGVCLNGWVRQLENNVLNPFMFGAYGDFIPKAQEVIERQSGHNDAVAFQNMYNMNKYTVFTNISKLPPQNMAEYTFEWGNQMFYIEDTLPVRSYQFTDCKGGKIFFNPIGNKDLFTTPRQEMIDAYAKNTGWNTQTICFVTFKNGCIVGNVTRTSTIHAQRCFDAANAYKWVWDNMLIERFALGISIYPLDTSSWTGGERIGNFYENELRNVTIAECITGLFNGGNATHASNLTIGGGYVVGKNYTNKFGYLLENHGAGFSCTGFNIAPAHRQNGLPLIYDKCWGSSYSGGYTEWFDTFFELHPQVRQGGFSFIGSHVFKEGGDLLVKIQDDVFSGFDYAANSRDIKPQYAWNQLFNSTGMTIGGKTDLITNFFKYVPQYDFKYGLYGVEADGGLTFDVKRSEQTWTGFTSKHGLRVLNFTDAAKSLRMPIENKNILANVCVLYRNISGFSHAEIKLNVLESDGTNAKITIAEDVIDYGNGWKLAVVRNINEIVSDGKLWIEIPANAQVEFEHIGAYSADGYPFMPTYTSYEPSINSGYDRLFDANTSGGFLLEGDTTRAFLSVVGGAVHARSKKPRVCTISGLVYPDITQGEDTVISTSLDALLFALSSSQPISNVGIGVILRVQQSGEIGFYRVVGRNFGGGLFSKNVKVSKELSTGRSISSGTALIYAVDHIKSAILVDI